MAGAQVATRRFFYAAIPPRQPLFMGSDLQVCHPWRFGVRGVMWPPAGSPGPKCELRKGVTSARITRVFRDIRPNDARV